MFKYLLISCVFFVLTTNTFAQSSFSGNESYWERNYVLFEHINDVDFLLNTNGGSSNDIAFTSSFLLKGFINQVETKNRLISFGISTDLFTEREGSYRFDEEGRYYIGELFNEISTAEFALVKFLNHKWAIQWGGGIGLLNKKKPITGLALWAQGGSDGAGGFHKILHNLGSVNHGQINISRDYLSPFLFINPAISRFYQLKSSEDKLPHTYVTEFGANLCTNFDALWLFWENDMNVHLLQFPVFKTIFDFQLLAQGNFKWHTDGICLDAGLGAELSVGRFGVGYKATKLFGEANVRWVDYVDEETMFSIFLKVKI